MKKTFIIAAALAMISQSAIAGGLDRSGQPIRVLFEEGNRVELSYGWADPDLTGTLGAAASGDMIDSDTQLGFAYKRDLSAENSFALVIDEPYGAATNYATGTGYPFAGSSADVQTLAVTAIGRRKFDGGFSVHAGLRAQSVESTVVVPPAVGYVLNGDKTWGYGYLIGAAYERPEIALRVALTYNSAIGYDQTITETSALGANTSQLSFDTPQSINLDAQTGIAADTLLFGSIRWVDWTAFEIPAPDYLTITGTRLLRFQDDRTTYTLGVGRKFNETWSGALSVTYEPSTDEITTDLGPADGRTAIGVGFTYNAGDFDITSGLRYVWVGDATSRNSASFTDNTAIGVGVRLGIKI